MNEKPVKVPMDFNEALRRIAKTPKDAVAQKEEPKKPARKKAAPSKKGERG